MNLPNSCATPSLSWWQASAVHEMQTCAGHISESFSGGGDLGAFRPAQDSHVCFHSLSPAQVIAKVHNELFRSLKKVVHLLKKERGVDIQHKKRSPIQEMVCVTLLPSILI